MSVSADTPYYLAAQPDASLSCLYLLNLPLEFNEDVLQQYQLTGELQSYHVVKGSEDNSQVGFFYYTNRGAADNAAKVFRQLHPEYCCQVGSEIAVRQVPVDNLYVRNMPAEWTEKDLKIKFSQYGTVKECRILHRGEDVRGCGGLVRMDSVSNATRAILALNGHVPHTGLRDFTSRPLTVRYADTPEEKARKQARKDHMAQPSRPVDFQFNGARLNRSLDLPTQLQRDRFANLQNTNLQMRPEPLSPFLQSLESNSPVDTTSALPLQLNSLGDATDLDDLLIKMSLSLSSPHSMDLGDASNSMHLGALTNLLLSQNNVGCQPSAPNTALMVPTCTSLYVKNLPPEADRLWMYERFAQYGAILSVKVLQEENSTRCRGVGFVNFGDPTGALKAIKNQNGLKVQDKHLHVSLQANRGCFPA